MNKMILLFLLMLPIGLMGKDYQVKIHVRNLPANSEPVLVKLYNGDPYIVDTLPSLDNNIITFRVPDNTLPGTLRAVLGFSSYAKIMRGEPTAVNLIFNKEDIELEIDFDKPQESVNILQSKENKIYFDFLKSDAIFFQKLGTLEYVTLNYPDKDEFYQKALEYYKKYHQQRTKQIDKTYAQNKNTLAGKIINTLKVPILEANLSSTVRDSLYKSLFLETVEFTDTTLLYTTAYTDKVFQFINMHMRRDLTPRENEASVIKAIDLLVPHLDANPNVQQHIMQFLINGFEINKMEEVLAHISTHYLQQCGGAKDIIKQRLEGYQKMAIGATVPNFTIMDINNNPVNLYNTIQPYKLILFWHTDCNHCQILMEELPDFIAKDDFKKHQIQIIGISIDEDTEVWKNYSSQHPMDWINTHVENGFDNETAAAYNLFATPSMFLIDADNKIIAKPTTMDELKKNISEL